MCLMSLDRPLPLRDALPAFFGVLSVFHGELRRPHRVAYSTPFS